MKLTDEQREEIQRSINDFGTNGITLAGLNLLLSSEQAWKEESQQWRMDALRVAIARDKYWGQLNHAIEVLKKIALADDINVPASEISEYARDFISSLNKEETT